MASSFVLQRKRHREVEYVKEQQKGCSIRFYEKTTTHPSVGILLCNTRFVPYTAGDMFAVVSIAGFQEKVQKGDKLKVPLLQGEPGTKIIFGDVLLLCKEGGEVVIGTPTVQGASVEVAIQKHGKADKVLVYKMHRRKRYRRTRGHRQAFTEIEVTGIKA